ncbi:MAG: asparagine synthase-related protein, partial [Acidimicrobiales bacterium]
MSVPAPPGPPAPGPTGIGLTPLDVASGMVLGPDDGVAALSPAPGAPAARAALEAVILDALRRPPCLVSFSGGRDSSALLATAASVARREGLPLPVPATVVFPDLQDTSESSWQEQVLTHLELPDWVRLQVHDELDTLGPVAREVLTRHGLLFPCNAHLQVPVLDAAAGGSVVTGVGGDELFTPSEWSRAARVLWGRHRLPRPRDLAWVAVAGAPRPLRRRFAGRRLGLSVPWLRPEPERLVVGQAARWLSAQPVRFDRVVRRWWWRCRYLQLGLRSFRLLGAARDVSVLHPFADPGVLTAMAAQAGAAGFGGRTEAMRALFGDLLPPAVVDRPTKAVFDGVLLNRYSMEFAQSWRGDGVDSSLVDPERLRRSWLEGPFDIRTLPAMQAAWLSTRAARA